MPTYLDREGKLIQTGIAVNEFSEHHKWIGLLAYKPHVTGVLVPYVSRTQIHPGYGSELNYMSEDEVISAMGYKLTDLTLISELPQTIHALLFVDVPEQNAG
ncbi:MAG: hypothetical protein E6R05_06540 [Candidatus Moraniibacteriota bacterium]|nr:MAG: hypothetical protein E6R05_06540 [Candidatus Moranbacteria bacterium]